jgi:hypothetical protein
LDHDGIDPFHCSSANVVYGMHDDKDEYCAPSPFVVRLDFIHVFIEVDAKCEPDGRGDFVQDSEQTGVVGRLCHFENPANETDSHWYRLSVRNSQGCANLLNFCFEHKGGIEAWWRQSAASRKGDRR